MKRAQHPPRTTRRARPRPPGRNRLGFLAQGVAAGQTAEHTSQEALRASATRFRELIEAWPEQVVLSVNLDAGRHEYVSPSMEPVLGYAPQEFYDDPGLGMAVVAPAWREQARGWIAEIKAGTIRPSYEFELTRKDGRTIWIHQVGVFGERGPGQDLRVHFSFRDITRERRGLEALRESEARFRELAEGWVDQVVIRINLNTGRYEYVSPGMEHIFGFKPEEFYSGKRGIVGSTVAPEWRGAVREWMAEARRGVLRPAYEYQLIDAWGRRRWVDQRCTLHHGPAGRPETVQGVLFDITERRRLEEELRASRSFLDCLIEESPVSLWVSDATGTLMRTNRALRQLFRVTEEEVAGRYNIFQDPQLEELGVLPQIRAVFEGGGTTRFILPYSTARIEGLELQETRDAYLDVTISAVQDAAGATTNLIVQHRDITEQKRMEEALGASERKYRTLNESMRDGYAATDLEGRVTEHNTAFREMLGYAEEEIARLTCRDITPAAWHGMEERILKEQVLARGYSDIYEKEYRRKDGGVFPVVLRTQLLRDSDGRPCGYWAIVRDITERKRAEEALRESNARIQRMLETASEGIMVTDDAMRITYCNRFMTEMLGYTEEELLGLSLPDLIFEADLSRHKVEVLRRRCGLSSRFERRFRRKDGAEIWTIFAGTPVLDPDGTYRGSFGMLTDITARRQAEEALARKDALLRAMLRNLPFDFWARDQELRSIMQSDESIRLWGDLSDGPGAEGHIHPQTRAIWRETDRKVLAQSPLSEERTLLLPSGEERIFQSVVAQIRDGEAVLGLLGINVDITERKRAEEALARKDALLSGMLRNLPFDFWARDRDMRVIMQSDASVRLWGDLVARPQDESKIPEAVLEKWSERHTRVLAGENITGEREYVFPGGESCIFHSILAPLREGEDVRGVLGINIDITERKRMEDALRRSQARFEALAELSGLAEATERKIAAFTLREALRLSGSEAGVLFFVSHDRAELTPLAWETGGEMPQARIRAFSSSGPEPWAEVYASRGPLVLNDFSGHAHLVPAGHMGVRRFLGVPALDGRRVSAVLALTNKAADYDEDDTLQATLLLDGMWRIVRARRDEERILASLREKEALLREVHHRVKNNLQVVSSLLDMAGRRLASEEARQSMAEVRAKVLAMSLIHAQFSSLGQPGAVNLERYVRALFQQLQTIYSGGLALSLALEDDLSLGLDQAVPLGLTLNEALTNVFKHAGGGRVELSAGQDGDGLVCILVRDEGPGLPPGLTPAKAESLGMKLMHGLVRHQLGGELEIASGAEGGGERPGRGRGVQVRIRFLPNMAT